MTYDGIWQISRFKRAGNQWIEPATTAHNRSIEDPAPCPATINPSESTDSDGFLLFLSLFGLVIFSAFVCSKP